MHRAGERETIAPRRVENRTHCHQPVTRTMSSLCYARFAAVLWLPAVVFAQQGESQHERLRGEGSHTAPFLIVHDPSTIIHDGDRYWLFHTGRGIASLWSADLKSWNRGPSAFQQSPEWIAHVVPDHDGRFWAPDAIRLGDRYLVYYSVSRFGKNTSAIALASSPALDPNSAEYKWTDHGIVVRTTADSNHNAIDPSVLLTSSGELWMAFGSFWSGIQ